MVKKRKSKAYIITGTGGYRQVKTNEFWLKTKKGYRKVKGKLITY